MTVLLQVATIITLVHGSASSIVRNPGRESLTITVTTWRSLVDTTPVAILIAPSRFTLAPGEQQVLRVRLREPCQPGRRIVTTFSPVPPVETTVTTAVARLLLVTRIVGKLVCSPSS